jgi:hypothetical protein
MNQLEIIAPNDVVLAEHAAVIRALGKRKIEGSALLELCRRGLISPAEARRQFAELYPEIEESK